VLQKLLVHGFFDDHLAIQLNQELLGLLKAHVGYLTFEGADVELLFEAQFK
jgi:hypothetical protein